MERHPRGEDRLSVLISAASKHGATAEIADRIGDTLSRRNFDVTVVSPEQVDAVEGYDAVVLGSAVYAGTWQKEAKELAERVAASEPSPLVWLFSSGPVGDPPKPDEDPQDAAGVIEATSPREHRVIAGKIDKERLSFGERMIMTALRAPEGDFRDWEEISSWAVGIADILEAERQTPEVVG